MSTTGMKPEWSAHGICPRTTHVSDKGLIHPARALRARRMGMQEKAAAEAISRQALPHPRNPSRLPPSCRSPPDIVSIPTESAEGIMPDSGARSAGTDDCLVATVRGARAHCVRGPLWFRVSDGHLRASGVKPAFFAYFLCGGDPKVVPVGQRK